MSMICCEGKRHTLIHYHKCDTRDTYAISHGSWAMQKGTKTSECYIARVADECDIAFHEFWYFCIATEP